MLGNVGRESVVHLYREPILALGNGSVDELQTAMKQPGEPTATRRPSVETVFHAAVGLARRAGRCPLRIHRDQRSPVRRTGRKLAGLCPDECVVLGRDSVFVPYVDPGVQLAETIGTAVGGYRDRYSGDFKSSTRNHGFIAVAATPPRPCRSLPWLSSNAASLSTASRRSTSPPPLSTTCLVA